MMQIYWLYSRYDYSIKSYEKELYEESETALDSYLDYRKQHPDTSTYVVSSIRGNKQSSDTLTGNHQWICEIYVADARQSGRTDSINPKNIIPLYESGVSDRIRKITFHIANPPSEQELYESVRIFGANMCSPFRVDSIKRDLKEKGISVCSINTIQEDTMRWESSYHSIGTILNPVIKVIYPYDILRKESVEIFIAVPISSVIMKLTYTLCLTLLISVVLITCLIIQILTIRKQEQVSRLRQNFISTMLHELKRPLFTLKMCISYLCNKGFVNDPVKMEAIISQSRNEVDNLSSYFSKLRELAFNDMSGIPVNISRLNLREVLSNAIAKVHKPADKVIDIELQCPDDLDMDGDKVYLSDMAVNLLENSIKYSDSPLSIRIGCEAVEHSVKISISDTGWGIPRSERKNIFNRFYRGKRAIDHKLPGIGLGLAYVYQIVLAHQGTLKLRSKENEGTTFEIVIPRER